MLFDKYRIDYWLSRDLWSEADFTMLLVGEDERVYPEGWYDTQEGKDFLSKRNEAAKCISQAVLAKVLPCVCPTDASAADKLYGVARYFRPREAITWARSKPIFGDFPFMSLLPDEVGYTSRKVSKAPPPVRPIHSSGSSGISSSKPVSKETMPPPNWEKWSKMPFFCIWEGVALSLNIDPDFMKNQMPARRYESEKFIESKEFLDRVEIAVRHGCAGKLPTQTLPIDEDANTSQDEFWTWAKTVDWEVPDAVTSSKPDLNRWRQEDLWEESELMALCCGFNPESSEDFFAKESIKSKLASAKERIQRAITSKVLAYDYKHTATQMERTQNKCYLFRPSDAIAWAAPKFPDFPFSPENKSAESVNSISDAPVSDSAQDIDAEFEKTLAEYLSKDSPEAYLANSSLSKWLKKEKWTIKEGLLIVSGIDPETAKVEWQGSGKDEPIKTVLKFGHAFVKSDKFNRRPALYHPNAELNERLLDSEKERFIAECSEVLHHNHDIWLRSDHETALAGKEYISIKYFLKWADSKGIKVDWLEWANKLELHNGEITETLDELSTASVAWKKSLIEQWPDIVKKYGIDAEAQAAMKYLKEFDRSGVIVTGGDVNEMVWMTNNGEKRTVLLKTVRNTISSLRNKGVI